MWHRRTMTTLVVLLLTGRNVGRGNAGDLGAARGAVVVAVHVGR